MTDNIGSLQDPTVVLEGTSSLLKFVSGQSDLSSLNEKLQNNKNPLMNVSDLQDVVKSIHGNNVGAELRGQELDQALEEILAKGDTFSDVSDGPFLHELLEGATVELPKNPVIERNPVLAARVERLRLQQNERAYQAMTKDVSAGKFHKEDTIAYQMNNMNRQLIAVGQLILSVAAGFAFGFFGIPMAVGGMEFGIRIMLGVLAGGVIAIAELYFLAKYMNAEDEAQDRDALETKTGHPHQD